MRLLPLVAAAALLLPTPAPAAAAASVVAIADGHIDMGPRLVDGVWKIQLRDDSATPVTWRPVPEVVLQAVTASSMTVPPGPQFAFLGASGAPVWLLPQVQRPGVLWPGWNTQDPSIASVLGREVTWVLHDVRGPGHFTLFLNGNFGTPEVVFDSGKPFPQETGIEANSHVHGNWAFSAPGSYALDIDMHTTAPDGRTLSDRQTLQVFVGDGDAARAYRAPAPTPAPTAPPSSGAAPAGPDRTGWLTGIAAGAALLLAGGGFWWRRSRRRTGGAA
ncbi:TIGR03773 family transporter-associated surface protein [Amycolatopsis sp.]|uniref:TIGR03773 family transporter-associated surface protein n=1 Tax=Amycolatopsis sp. TaxID=37632 RepID=UPI002D8048F0|nr:TIGR03773 family transporter-associated surface protein [Amycolatopsis sp.]HET6704467.1 TIGR03773 family transporter-associated surface protein [Amycolatopsis sp.]